MSETEGMSHKELKALAKARRPWYKKKRFWLLGFVIVVILAVASSGGSSDNTNTASDNNDTSSDASSDSSVRSNSSNSDNPPADDVEITSCGNGVVGPQAKLKVTNNSSKRSTYLISVAFEDGSTQVGTATAIVNNLEPGSTKNEDANSFEEHDGTFTCRVTDVDRTST